MGFFSFRLLVSVLCDANFPLFAFFLSLGKPLIADGNFASNMLNHYKEHLLIRLFLE